MAIITIQEVAQVGDKFYTPGQYEVPDQSVFYDRNSAVVDFLGSNLVDNNRITGLMIIQAENVTLKRYDTFILDGGLSPVIDAVGNVILTDKQVSYRIVTMKPWFQKGGATAAAITIESDSAISVPEDERYTAAVNGNRLFITTSVVGEYNIPVTLDGLPADPLIFTVSELKVTTESNKKSEPAIGKIVCLEDDKFVPGLELTATNCTITEKADHYEIVYTGTPAASVTVKIKVKDPVYAQRSWKVPDMKFWYADVTAVTLEGADTTELKAYDIKAIPTPTLTYGEPTWTVSGDATIEPKGTAAVVTPTKPGVFTVTAKWHKVTATKEVTVISAATDFTVEGMPTEVENGKNYKISVTPVPASATGKADFSSSIDGVTITDHRDNTATINVIDMKGPGDVTVYWGDIMKDYPLTLKEIPLTVVVDPTNPTEVNAGETVTLKVKWDPEAPEDVLWTVSNDALLTILEDTESSVTIKLSEKASEGNQWCTITGGGKEFRLQFRVKALPAYTIRFSDNYSKTIRVKDDKEYDTTLVVTVSPSDGPMPTAVSKTPGIRVDTIEKRPEGYFIKTWAAPTTEIGKGVGKIEVTVGATTTLLQADTSK